MSKITFNSLKTSLKQPKLYTKYAVIALNNVTQKRSIKPQSASAVKRLLLTVAKYAEKLDDGVNTESIIINKLEKYILILLGV